MCVGVSFGISTVMLGLAVMCVGVLDEFSPLLHQGRRIHVQDNAGIQTQVDFFFQQPAVNNYLNPSGWMLVVQQYEKRPAAFKL